MKKVIATIGMLLPFTAMAQVGGYLDVPADAWYAPHVVSLSEAGIFDEADYFRPADNLKRAELVKLVIEATGGLGAYEAPPYPTFDDVPEDAWFGPYVEEAATRGIVSGYADASGSFTGFFGPGDKVSRGAAAKILVNAFELPELDTAVPGFPDVKPGDWFYPFVVTAYQHGIVQGYENGKFGPNDPVSRAQIAKMIGLILFPPAEEPTTADGGVAEPTAPTSPAPTEPTAPTEPLGVIAEPSSDVVAEGPMPAGGGVLTARYTFKAMYEGVLVQTLTVVNDTVGSDYGDDKTGTFAISQVTIRYPDRDGYLQTASAPLDASGEARFTNLEYFTDRLSESFIEVYAQLNSFPEVGEMLSGERFRLGIQNVGNTSTSFQADGDASGGQITFGDGIRGTRSAADQPAIVRKSVPSFALEDADRVLIEGSNTLMDFSVSADSAGGMGLARLTLEVSLSDSDSAGLSLGDLKLYRGSGYLSEGVQFYDATGGQDLGFSTGNSLSDGLSTLVISFEQEEIIAAGSTQNYSLRATASGVTSGDSIGLRLKDGDENQEVSGLSANPQQNTGKIFADGDGSVGLFTAAEDFAQGAFDDRNVIWTDRSADLHLYPSFSAGLPVSGTGSADFTNGYRLGLSALPTVILSN